MKRNLKGMGFTSKSILKNDRIKKTEEFKNQKNLSKSKTKKHFLSLKLKLFQMGYFYSL